VSGDLHSHPVGYFIEGLLAHLDRRRLELVGYPTAVHSDELTARLRRRLDYWKAIVGLSDQAAAERIHADGIDILIDLAGHTAHNRLPVFAFKPAPVQVTWLGYFATTGLSQMDYLLADPVSVPLAHQGHFSETIWYLPDTRLCFTAPQVELPVVPLPALARGGRVMFGNFQNLAKLGDEVLARWAAILAGCPGAWLRLQNKQLADAGVREQLRQRLRSAGIDPQRVAMHGPQQRQAYLAAYGEVDIVLDSFPYPGGTTTCEALWMGVPTVTLAGERLIARQGASLLSAAGLADWVAATPAEYVDKALSFARDLPALAGLRARLRAQMLASPLCDAPRFARHFESALWAMWQRWQSAAG
jgi:predicted O-linked N-acetylglucosamine transferase (SPINDLY family)